MGDLEYHDKKVAEAHEQGKAEGLKEAGGGGDIIIGIFIVIIFLAFFTAVFADSPERGGDGNGDSSQVSQISQVITDPSLPADIGNYISPDAVRFYKYIGSGGEVYVRHHYEPTDLISKQGYYRSDTNEYILVDINFSSVNENPTCNWRIYYCANGNRNTIASGNDPVDIIGISSLNCQHTLSRQLEAYGFDSITYNTNGYFGDEISRSEAFSIIGYVP